MDNLEITNDILWKPPVTKERHSFRKAFWISLLVAAINFSVFLWIAFASFESFSFGAPCQTTEFTTIGTIIVLSFIIIPSLFFWCYMIRETIYLAKESCERGSDIFCLWLDGIVASIIGCIISVFPMPLIFYIVCSILNLFENIFNIYDVVPVM